MGSLTSVETLTLRHSTGITSLDDLGSLTSIVETLNLTSNSALPDCEACQLIDQLTVVPPVISIYDNLDDSCTPVPENCP